MGSCFSPLEQAVLTAICEMYSSDQAVLGAQLATATLLSCENTGAGFYTRFAVERAASATLAGGRSRAGPETKIDGLRHGMGFILWLKEGYADCLEAYSYGESTTGLALEAVGFEVLRG